MLKGKYKKKKSIKKEYRNTLLCILVRKVKNNRRLKYYT